MRQDEQHTDRGIQITTNPLEYVVPRSWRFCSMCLCHFRKEPGWKHLGHPGPFGAYDRYVCAQCAPTSTEAWGLLTSQKETPK